MMGVRGARNYVGHNHISSVSVSVRHNSGELQAVGNSEKPAAKSHILVQRRTTERACNRLKTQPFTFRHGQVTTPRKHTGDSPPFSLINRKQPVNKPLVQQRPVPCIVLFRAVLVLSVPHALVEAAVRVPLDCLAVVFVRKRASWYRCVQLDLDDLPVMSG